MNRQTYISSFVANDDALQGVFESIHEHGLPPISVAPEYGQLLTFLVRLTGARQILEIGALAGYSSICLARGLGAKGDVTSLELNADFAALAQSNAKVAGVSNRIQYQVGPALQKLEQFVAAKRQFDFFFIDADKPNYPQYLELCVQLAQPGALLVADNVFLGDRLLNPDNHDPSTTAMRVFHQKILTTETFDTVLFPMHDGLSVTRINK